MPFSAYVFSHTHIYVYKSIPKLSLKPILHEPYLPNTVQNGQFERQNVAHNGGRFNDITRLKDKTKAK